MMIVRRLKKLHVDSAVANPPHSKSLGHVSRISAAPKSAKVVETTNEFLSENILTISVACTFHLFVNHHYYVHGDCAPFHECTHYNPICLLNKMIWMCRKYSRSKQAKRISRGMGDDCCQSQSFRCSLSYFKRVV